MREPPHRGELVGTRLKHLEERIRKLEYAENNLAVLRQQLSDLTSRISELEQCIIHQEGKVAFNKAFPWIPGGPMRGILEPLYHCSPEFYPSKKLAFDLYNRPGIACPLDSVASAVWRIRHWLRRHHPEWQIIGKHRVGYCLVRTEAEP